jgi:hypothetical protein
MLPTVCKILGVEMIRDGGSLAAKFESSAGQYILFFQIHVVDRGPFEREQLGYREPVIIDCDPRKRPPNSSAVHYSELSGPSIPISWNEARNIVDEIAGLAQGLSPPYAEWLNEMICACANDGHLPPSPSRLKRVRRLGDLMRPDKP